jgi:hypothetical protein
MRTVIKGGLRPFKAVASKSMLSTRICAVLMVLASLCESEMAPLPARADTARSQIRGWVKAQPVVRCFPGFIGYNFFADKYNPPGAGPIPTLPINPIHTFLRINARDLRKAVIYASGTSASIHELSAAFDTEISTVAIYDQYYEYGELVVLSKISTAPSAFRRRRLHVDFGGIGIGSQKRDVENLFGYGPPYKAKGVTNCGMRAERFQTQGSGAGMEFIFIFKDDQVVAMEEGGGS